MQPFDNQLFIMWHLVWKTILIKTVKPSAMQTVTTITRGSLETSPSSNKVLKLNGYSAIQRCTLYNGQEGVMLVEGNILLFVIEGNLKIRYGKAEHAVGKNQMTFLKKDILVEYENCDQTDEAVKVEYILINLKYELVVEFTRLAKLPVPETRNISPVAINELDRKLVKYIDSLEAYFAEPEKVEGSLVKIKLLELLFAMMDNNNTILRQVLDLRDHYRSDITATVEENIMNSLSLHQLAVLAGRSLSSFRRDFLAIYNMPPSQWIRQKRLEKAQELLLSTTMTVTDICYTAGFENIAHFSRLFKSQFRCSPSEFRVNMLVA